MAPALAGALLSGPAIAGSWVRAASALAALGGPVVGVFPAIRRSDFVERSAEP